MKTAALNVIIFVANSPLVGCGRGNNYLQIKKVIKEEFGEISPTIMRKKYPELETYFKMSDDFLSEHPKSVTSYESREFEEKLLAKLKENNLTLVEIK